MSIARIFLTGVALVLTGTAWSADKTASPYLVDEAMKPPIAPPTLRLYRRGEGEFPDDFVPNDILTALSGRALADMLSRGIDSEW